MGAPVLRRKVPSLRQATEVNGWVGERDWESDGRALDEIGKQLRDEQGKLFRREIVTKDSWKARFGQRKGIIFGDHANRS
jgi:hypothetical protein